MKTIFDEEFKGGYIFNDVTLVEIKKTAYRYSLGYMPGYKKWIVNFNYYGDYEEYKFIPQKNPVVSGKCIIENKEFLIIREKNEN